MNHHHVLPALLAFIVWIGVMEIVREINRRWYWQRFRRSQRPPREGMSHNDREDDGQHSVEQ